MSAFLRGFPRSLAVRLLVPLVVIAVAVLAVYAFVSLRTTRQHFLELVENDAARASYLVRQATHDAMLLNRKDEVQRLLQRLAEGQEVADIRVYDKRGRIFLAADSTAIGQSYAMDSQTCVVCHGVHGRPSPAASEGTIAQPRVIAGNETLRHLTVIENEPGCFGCHPAQAAVLGVLDVEMSMAPLHAALRSSRTQVLWTTLTLILFTVLASGVFLRRGILKPVRQLHAGTARIAAGDLETRIQVRGHHELADLAAAFNRMSDDLHAARREIVDWSRTLEEKVHEKTDELRKTQRQVLHMERMASLGKLSATVAHELNNPLSGILTYAKLVEKDIKKQNMESGVRDELVHYLQLMARECARCGTIVQNLLLFARHSRAEMAPVNLNEIVERSLMLVRHHLEIHGIRLRKQLLTDRPEIVANGNELQQALIALFVNAVEAMAEDDAGGELSVCMRAEGDSVHIDVGDTGVGIPEAAIQHIFEPFFSTKDKESGVGLGLAVVYGIVRRHGGDISVETAPGRGTMFRMRLRREPPGTLLGAPESTHGQSMHGLDKDADVFDAP